MHPCGGAGIAGRRTANERDLLGLLKECRSGGFFDLRDLRSVIYLAKRETCPGQLVRQRGSVIVHSPPQ